MVRERNVESGGPVRSGEIMAGADLRFLASDWLKLIHPWIVIGRDSLTKVIFSTVKETDRKFQSQGITKECFCNLAHGCYGACL